ncbi:hypothetical protein LPJ57_002528 [Coemansia sp. RSA 486]|nr:hypothetical protein LPJ57_002528 [Coemansia sp. RSA 486]
MSSSITVVYGGGKTVSIKTTPTTTLQTVLNNVCEKINSGGLNPDTQTLVYNNKPMDLSLTIRFANLPQGAKLKLTPRSGARIAAAAAAGSKASAGNGPPGAQRPNGGQSTSLHDGPVKVALQIVGSGRVIKDYKPSDTLWDIIVTTETSSGGALNLTNRYRVPESGSLSPAGRGLGYLSSALSRITGSSGYNSETEEDSGTREKTPSSAAPSPRQIYQQPMLVVLNKEVSSLQEMQSTTLKSLGFSSGSSVMIRLSFKDSASPPAPPPARVSATPAPRPAQVAASAPVTPIASATTAAVIADTPLSAEPNSDQHNMRKTALGITVPADHTSKQEVASSGAEQPFDTTLLAARQIHVYAPPSTSSTPQGSRIELPDSFYQEDSASDLKLLISVQRERQAESERGFRSRIKQEQEEQKKHEQLKQKYPKTAIRFRFPDLAQIQATFSSSDAIEELFKFVREILDIPQTLQTLVVQPPVQDLGKSLGTTLFDAKLAPAAVVHVKLQAGMADNLSTGNLVKASVWQNAEKPADVMGLADDGRAAAEDIEMAAAGSDSRTAARAGSAPAPAPAPAPSSAASAEGGPRMPKWFLAGQRRA